MWFIGDYSWTFVAHQHFVLQRERNGLRDVQFLANVFSKFDLTHSADSAYHFSLNENVNCTL